MKDIELKIGDIVLDMDGSSWGNTKFIIDDFCGCPNLRLAWSRQLNKPNMNKYHCNLIVKLVRVVDSVNRPMRNLNKVTLLKLVSRGIPEARREFTMRVNSKTL
jgi:hypothetical protein